MFCRNVAANIPEKYLQQDAEEWEVVLLGLRRGLFASPALPERIISFSLAPVINRKLLLPAHGRVVRLGGSRVSQRTTP